MMAGAPPSTARPAPSGPVREPARDERLARIHGLAAAGGPEIVLRRVVDLRTSRLLAVEALPQFPGGADPRRWLAEFGDAGVTTELELAVVAAAIGAVRQVLAQLPDGTGLWVAASPGTVCARPLRDLLAASPVPVTVWMTEPAIATDRPELLTVAAELRQAGVGLAVEGVAAEHRGLRHVLRLGPAAVRLAPGLTRGVHRDLARAELARTVVRVARHLGATAVAADIRDGAEADALLALGVTAGHGPGLPDADTLAEPPAGVPPASPDAERRLEDLVGPVLELVVAVTGLETAYLTLLDPGETWLEHRFVCNTGTLEVPEGLTIPWIDSLCKRCRDAGLLWTSDVPNDLPPIPLGRDAPIQTFVSVPVQLADGRLAGTLCAMGSTARDLDGDVLAEIAFFARLFAECYAAELGGPAPAAPMTHSRHLAAESEPAT